MKKLKNIYLFVTLTFIVELVNGSDTTSLKTASSISGIYRVGLKRLL